MISSTSSLNIALISEQRSSYLRNGYSEEQCAALTHEGEVQAVLTTLQSLGHHVTLLPGIESLVQLLAAGEHKRWDLAFNMAQGFHGTSREAQVPALLEAYQIPFTFSDAATISLCQNKALTKIILDRYKIPTAPFQVISTTDGLSSLSKIYGSLPPCPLFIKPVTEGSSKGIAELNKLNDLVELKPALQELSSKFRGQDILIEAFLSGREFTVSILGTGLNGRVIGIREHTLQSSHVNENDLSSELPRDFVDRLSKSSQAGQMVTYQDLPDMDDPQVKAACEVALQAWRLFSCRDCGRVDVRFGSKDLDSVPNVMEINPIAGLLPDHSPLPATAKMNGLSYKELIREILESCLQRINSVG